MSTTPHAAINKFTNDGTSWKDVLAYVTGGYWIDNQHLLQSTNGQVVTALVQPEAGSQPLIRPRSAILHSNAAPRLTLWQSLVSYWRRADVSGEAHFQVDGVNSDDPFAGRIVQAMPLNRRADCNYKANGWWHGDRYVGAISFETQDKGGTTLASTPWSFAQLHAIIGALTAICVVYGVSCTDTPYWNSSGIGFHSRFPEWSIYVGKTCPGAFRIMQMSYIRGQVADNLAAFGAATGWTCGTGA